MSKLCDDECIARAERDVDLAAGWLAADKDDADARQNYQHCVAVRDFLRAHKRITESVSEQILQNQLAEADRRAAGRPEPVAEIVAHGAVFRDVQLLQPAPEVGTKLYGPDILAYADWMATERELAYRSEDITHNELVAAERQLAELQAKHDALVKEANAVIEWWRTTAWGDVPETAVFINNLRAAMSAVALDKGGE